MFYLHSVCTRRQAPNNPSQELLMKWRGGGGSVFFVAVFGQIRALKFSSISLSWKMRIYLVSDIFDRVWISRFFKKKISYRYLCSSKILKENLVWKRIILEILNVQFIIIYYNLIIRVYIYTFVAESVKILCNVHSKRI